MHLSLDDNLDWDACGDCGERVPWLVEMAAARFPKERVGLCAECAARLAVELAAFVRARKHRPTAEQRARYERVPGRVRVRLSAQHVAEIASTDLPDA